VLIIHNAATARTDRHFPIPRWKMLVRVEFLRYIACRRHNRALSHVVHWFTQRRTTLRAKYKANPLRDGILGARPQALYAFEIPVSWRVCLRCILGSSTRSNPYLPWILPLPYQLKCKLDLPRSRRGRSQQTCASSRRSGGVENLRIIGHDGDREIAPI